MINIDKKVIHIHIVFVYLLFIIMRYRHNHKLNKIALKYKWNNVWSYCSPSFFFVFDIYMKRGIVTMFVVVLMIVNTSFALHVDS